MTDTAQARSSFIATRRQLLVGGAAAAAAGFTGIRAGTAHAATSAPAPALAPQVGGIDRATIQRWAGDTWASLVAMTDPHTGLPADNISGPLVHPRRSGYTSPTNIGGYMWATVVARELGIISAAECRQRLTQTLTTLSRLKHHEPSGMFYNWYDEATRRRRHRLAGGRQPDLSLPLQRGQRVVRRVAHGRPQRGAGSCRSRQCSS